MPSSAGSRNPQLPTALWLAAVALAALALSLLLAFAFATVSRPDAKGGGARRTTAKAPIATPVQLPAVWIASGAARGQETGAGGAAGAGPNQPPLLWALLAPWAFAVDVVAVLGLAAVLIVRYNTRRRGDRM